MKRSLNRQVKFISSKFVKLFYWFIAYSSTNFSLNQIISGPLLGLSDGIENLGAPQWELTLALIACWLIVVVVVVVI